MTGVKKRGNPDPRFAIDRIASSHPHAPNTHEKITLVPNFKRPRSNPNSTKEARRQRNSPSSDILRHKCAAIIRHVRRGTRRAREAKVTDLGWAGLERVWEGAGGIEGCEEVRGEGPGAVRI